MYSYEWDTQTGGYLLNSTPLLFSKEPRPVYYQELDILGFDKYWNYEKNDAYPYMWAEANNYIYRGRLVAKTKGGSLYTAPELLFVEDPEPDNLPLRFVDIPLMVEKNREFMEPFVKETIKKIYNTYREYKNKVDVFYVAFSGGKDSVVALDLVQRALPHNAFKVLFGDTGMEFPDTYDVIDKIKHYCEKNEIEFLRIQSNLPVESTWKCFGPPAVTIRWCCSVHKTTPQILLLRRYTNNSHFRGMAFTGIRGDESVTRHSYDIISYGEKIKGQYSCHPILEWNCAELFLYMYINNLPLNQTYKKGNSRAGCLMCPMSSGKHEYMKAQCYPNEMKKFVSYIRDTSGKTDYSIKEKNDFINGGYWRTRKSGRELNFGYDRHIIEINKGKTFITVFCEKLNWQEWAKTIGKVLKIDEENYTIDYQMKTYGICCKKTEESLVFSFTNCGIDRDDINFISLFRGVIIKSIYCINCGVCEANCSNGCIDMSEGLRISENCTHCHQCHKMNNHCLRYNSIRNTLGGNKKMGTLDRYYSFGIRKEWLRDYFKYKGLPDFWNTNGDGEVVNKKKDAFLSFVKDANIVFYDKLNGTDKYTKYKPTDFAKILFSFGVDSEITWALMLCNLVYTEQFRWYIKSINFDETYTPEKMKLIL